MTDKDMTKRELLVEKIPTVQFLLCLFHVLCTFRRNVTCQKMGITAVQRISVLEILSKLAMPRTKVNYHLYYQQLRDTKIKSVVEYYDQN